MSTGRKCKSLRGAFVTGAAILCLALSVAAATTQHTQKKTKKPDLPVLPTGPTGPMQQIPLESIAAVPPTVTYQNNELTIIAPNSTLADILRAVRKQTGAEIEVPSAPERVVTRLGPGPAREVMAQLLNGSRFNYVILGSASDDAVLTRVVLVTKSMPDTPPVQGAPEATPGIAQAQSAPVSGGIEPGSPEAAEEDDSADQAAADAEQQNGQSDQQKTPQQMMQEMQQRQMQLQQQQQQGQPVLPGGGRPGYPPPPQS